MSYEQKKLKFLRKLTSSLQEWREAENETLLMGHKEVEEFEEPLAKELEEIILERFKEVHGDKCEKIPFNFYTALGFEENNKKLNKIVDEFEAIDVYLPFVVSIHWRCFIENH